MARSIAVLVGVVVLWCGTARADDKAAAEQLFRIGAAAYNAFKFDAAAKNFDRAYELYKAPEIAFSGAQAHRLQYQADRDPVHAKRAIELFEAYVAAVPSGGKRRDALAHLERLRDVVGRLEASGTKIVIVEKQTPSIYVSVPTEGALITIDGKAVDRYTSQEVSIGEHTVAVSADGYFPEERKVQVAKGQAMVPIELRPRPATLSITSASDARVLVDGRELVGTSVEPGKRLVTVYARGREPVTQELELTPGQELTLDVPLRPTMRRRAVKWVVVGTGALLAGALVTGTIALVADFSAADLRDSSTPLDAADTKRYEKLRDRRGTYRTTSVLFGTAALAAAGTALWMYYFDAPSPTDLGRPRAPKQEGLAPLVLANGFGLSYGGVFR